MKSQLLALNVILLLFLVTACNNNPCLEPEAHEKETLDKEEMKAELEELFEETQRLMEAKDVEGLVQRFTANGTLKLPMSPLIQGHDALRENYKTTTELEDFNLHISTLNVEISEAGDMASVLGEFAVSFNTPQGPFQDSGYSLFSMVRENNQWKIAAEVLSSMPQNQ